MPERTRREGRNLPVLLCGLLAAGLDSTPAFAARLRPAPARAATGAPARGADRGVPWWNLHLAQDLWPDARLIANVRAGSGNGLDPFLGDRANTHWMAGEPRLLYVSNVYLEQKLLGDRLTVALDKLDITDYFDTNAVTSWNFLLTSVVLLPQAGRGGQR